jgi:hypothetical protein
MDTFSCAKTVVAPQVRFQKIGRGRQSVTTLAADWTSRVILDEPTLIILLVGADWTAVGRCTAGKRLVVEPALVSHRSLDCIGASLYPYSGSNLREVSLSLCHGSRLER